MRSVAVYGKDSPEKNRMMNKLIENKFKFINSTPPGRFHLINNGVNPPINLAPLQILFLNLSEETSQSLSSLSREHLLLDFDRPLLFLVKGRKNDLKNNCLNDYKGEHIRFEYIDSLDDIEIDHIEGVLNYLDIHFYHQTLKPR